MKKIFVFVFITVMTVVFDTSIKKTKLIFKQGRRWFKSNNKIRQVKPISIVFIRLLYKLLRVFIIFRGNSNMFIDNVFVKLIKLIIRKITS